MNILRTFAASAVATTLQAGAPVLAAPSTSSVSFQAGLTYGANGLVQPLSSAAELLGSHQMTLLAQPRWTD